MAGERLTEKALVIHPGRIHDLKDVAMVAHAEGKKLFNTSNNIRVLPWLVRDVNKNYVVVVDDMVGRTGTQASSKDDVGT